VHKLLYFEAKSPIKYFPVFLENIDKIITLTPDRWPPTSFPRYYHLVAVGSSKMHFCVFCTRRIIFRSKWYVKEVVLAVFPDSNLTLSSSFLRIRYLRRPLVVPESDFDPEEADLVGAVDDVRPAALVVGGTHPVVISYLL
jgi:hypothetical protein